MPLQFIEKDITKLTVDVIVNPTDEYCSVDGNISKAIHIVAGEELAIACEHITPLHIGDVKATQAYGLPCKYVFHTALPDWYGGKRNEREHLDSCYTEALYLADDKKCKSICFPLLGIGLYGYPINEATEIAIRAIQSYLTIKDNINVFVTTTNHNIFEEIQKRHPKLCGKNDVGNYDAVSDLEAKLKHLDYQFFDSLTYYINKMNYTPAQCYKAAGIDKKLFSKIKNGSDYLPSKTTIIRFAFALHLSVDETQQLLSTCGYILSDSLRTDVIIKHFLSQRRYDFDELNKWLKNERSL